MIRDGCLIEIFMDLWSSKVDTLTEAVERLRPERWVWVPPMCGWC